MMELYLYLTSHREKVISALIPPESNSRICKHTEIKWKSEWIDRWIDLQIDRQTDDRQSDKGRERRMETCKTRRINEKHWHAFYFAN
jgi:hypothetical protein